ncbi:MAG: diphthine--ammonia ligase [Candidatus Bathyarchaeia archaeon]
MRVAVLFSGGKDSCYTIMRIKEQGHNVGLLVTIIPKSNESRLFHYPCVELTSLQAEAMNLPILTYNIGVGNNGEVEELEKHLSEAKRLFNIEGIALGALASRYQKSRFEEAAGRVKLECLTPLWGIDPKRLLNEELDAGLKVIIVAVAALGLGRSWLGRSLDREAVKGLLLVHNRYGVNLAGEGGEYETLVLDAPIFKKRLEIRAYRKIWFGDSGYIKVDEVGFGQK